MAMPRKIDEAKLRELWFDLSWTITGIADHFGVRREAVQRAAKRINLPPRAQVRGINEDELRRLWAEPIPVSEICEKLQCSHAGVTQAARRMGLPPRTYNKRRRAKVTKAQLEPLWSDGASLKAIGSAFGVSPSYVSQLAYSFGLPARKQFSQGGRRRDADEGAADDGPAPPPLPKDRPPGPYSAADDGRILATRGRYQDVAALAKRMKRPSAVILARYHALARRA